MSATASQPTDVRPPPHTPSAVTRSLGSVPLARYLGLPVVVLVSGVLNMRHLSQNGYANVFYSAGVQSMLHSLHNFLFVSFDPGGLISVDKPPVALWVQVLSAKLFGLSPLSLLLPEAIAGMLAVIVLYLVLMRRLGAAAACAGALALAVFPSFVAVSRDNGVDPMLLLLMIGAAAVTVRACEGGRSRTLLFSGLLVGLAFNTKTLAAYLVVPPIVLAYLVCAPGSLRRRVVQLFAFGVLTLAVSFAWIGLVEVTPASKRPYVGGSTNNTEINLIFGYNGFGRVEGEEGGPNSVTVRPGAFVPLKVEQRSDAVSSARRRYRIWRAILGNPAEHVPKPEPAGPPIAVGGREKEPTPFGPSPRLLRLFGKGLGDQAGWLLPFALLGLIALATLLLPARRWRTRRPRPDTQVEPRWMRWAALRRDQRLALLIVFGSWFLVQAAVLSISKGIVHPYYVSALAPGTGAMVGAGVYALIELARGQRRLWGILLFACTLATTLTAEVVLMYREHYLQWFIPVLIIGAVLATGALLAARRLAAPAVALACMLVLIAPAAYAAVTWRAPVEGTFPAAGPKAFPGPGGYGVDRRDLAIDRAIVGWISTHSPGSRWELLTVASDTAAPTMLMGLKAGSIGGYSGDDPALNGSRLARYVERGEARYIALGGAYSMRGGNGASHAVLRACRELPSWEWHSPVNFPYGLVLFDCKGDAPALAAAGRRG
ncbi:MAG: ArnT family glycosyltransferase [Solirubrobacteraceae bacterium]